MVKTDKSIKFLDNQMKELLRSGLQDQLGYLYDRWQDEKGYENFEDYKKLVKKHIEKANENLQFCNLDQEDFSILVLDKRFINYIYLIYVMDTAVIWKVFDFVR